jgi:ABC-2 type transport system permease protein
MFRLFSLYLRNAIKPTPGKVILIIFIAVSVEVSVLVQAFAMGVMGSASSLPVMFFMAGLLLTFITSVPNAKSMLFAFRDFDLISSMPISPRSIIASRLLVFIASETIYTAALLVPAFIVYGIFMNPGELFIISAILLTITAAILPSVIGAVFGVLAAFFTSRFRFGKILQFIALLVITIAGFAFQFAMNSGISPDVTDKVTGSAIALTSNFYPARLFDEATSGNLTSLVLFLLMSVFLLMLFAIVFGRVFTQINTILTAVSSGRKWVAKSKDWKNSGAFKALFLKDLKLFFGSPVYVFNAGFGALLMLIVAVLAAVMPIQTILGWIGVPPEIGITNAQISSFVPLVLSFFPAMTCTTSASISIEGKRLGLLASLPVSPRKIYLAKLAVNWIVIVPIIIISGVILVYRLNPVPSLALMYFAVPIAFAFLTSASGMFFNLLLPKLAWTTEQQAVKQSLSVLLSVFLGMAVIGIAFTFSLIIGAATTAVYSFLGVLALGAFFTLLIFTWGKGRLVKIL